MFSHLGIIAQVLRDPSVRSNAPLLKYVTNIKEEGTKRAAALKSSITFSTNRYIQPIDSGYNDTVKVSHVVHSGFCACNSLHETPVNCRIVA